MRFENFKIRLYYKLNKLKKGKWAKKDNYLTFFGDELPSFNSKMDNNESKIYEGDTVIYRNKNKPGHANNGLKALVIKVHKPLKLKEKIEAWENNRRGPYPLEDKKYDLAFLLDEDEKEDRRINLTEGNKRSLVKMKMTFVDKTKIKRIPEKVLMLSVKKSSLDGLNSQQKEKLLRKKVKNLFKQVFKKGTEFKPKYVDKRSKNYDSWEERNRAEGFFVDKSKEKTIIKGDIITSVDILDNCSKKTYMKPKKNHVVNSYDILEINVDDALNVVSDSFFIDDLENDFYTQEGLKDNVELIDEAKNYLVNIRGSRKIRDSSRYARAVMEKRSILRSTKNDASRLKKWEIFLTSLMIKKTFRRDLKVVNHLKEGEWVSVIQSSGLFDFMSQNNNKFLLRPVIEQLYIIRQIIGLTGEPGLLSRRITDTNDMSIIENSEKKKELQDLLRKYANRSIKTGNIPRIIVKAKFYLQRDDELGSKLGFSPKCEQSIDELKNVVGSLFGFIGKRNKKTKKRKNKGKGVAMDEDYIGGRKSLFKKSLFKKKRTKKKRVGKSPKRRRGSGGKSPKRTRRKKKHKGRKSTRKR